MSALLLFTEQLQQQAMTSNQRRILRLQGDLSWCYQQVALLIDHLQLSYFWSGASPEGISSVPYKQLLGRETSLLIINAYQCFDANAFAACEGTLRGGGLLILLTAKSISSNDLFYQYINTQLSLYKVATIHEDRPLPLIATQDITVSPKPQLNLCQQHVAITAIIKTVSGHRRRPLVLTANRGRGKSAALGIAAAQLLDSGLNSILVCAPNKQATSTLFKHASLLTENEPKHSFSINKGSQSIRFISPDTLINEQPKCDLLIIDEAAALPVPTLETITNHYSRLVFATTQHGYEGSGRGFALRFQKRLHEICPQWRSLHLELPIRWATEDPLESFTLNSLCLNEPCSDDPMYDRNASVQFEKLTARELMADHSQLQEIFSLLVLAHYQTKPSDLEKLLNDTHLHIFVMKQNKQLLGVALINNEGGLNPQLCEHIFQGIRRIPGNLIAQSLTFHCANKKAGQLHYARIQRIAIHPQLQHLGLGKQFIAYLTHWAITEKFDHLCASFGATHDLQRFWQQLAFTTLRIGFTKDTSSGTHSLIINKPLSNKGKSLHQEIQQQFKTQLAIQLERHLQYIDSAIIANLLNEFDKTPCSDFLLTSYCYGNLPYEFAESVLIKLLLNCNLKHLSPTSQYLAIEKILQNHSWTEIAKKHHLTGKKQAQITLKNTIRTLIEEEKHASR